MFPSVTTNDLANGRGGHIHHLRQLNKGVSALIVESSHLQNLCLRKFCTTLAFALRLPVSALLVHVAYIILLCAKFEVRRIYTAWIVAGMHYNSAVWDLAVMNLVGETMCRGVISVFDAQLTISVLVSGSSPKPALFRGLLVYFCPKTLGCAWEIVDTPLMPLNKTNRLPSDDSSGLIAAFCDRGSLFSGDLLCVSVDHLPLF